MVAIAGAAAAEAAEGACGCGGAAAELMIGAVGTFGGRLLRGARRLGWVAEDFAGTAVLALTLLAYAAALSLHGNGFVAAFCGAWPSVLRRVRAGPRN